MREAGGLKLLHRLLRDALVLAEHHAARQRRQPGTEAGADADLRSPPDSVQQPYGAASKTNRRERVRPQERVNAAAAQIVRVVALCWALRQNIELPRRAHLLADRWR